MKTALQSRGLTLRLRGDVLEVLGVIHGSVAEESGLERGDQIVSLFGMPFSSCLRDELLRRLHGTCLVGIRDRRTDAQCQQWLNLGSCEIADIDEEVQPVMTRRPTARMQDELASWTDA